MSSTVSSGRRDTWEKQNPAAVEHTFQWEKQGTDRIEYLREKKV